MSADHMPAAERTPNEARVRVPLLNHEARIIITPGTPGAKPKPLKDAPTLRGDKLMAELVIEARR